MDCTLQELIKRETLSLPKIICILLDICTGMNFLHFLGIMHRDMNLGNFLVSKDSRVKVSDLGLGRTVIKDESVSADVGAGKFRAPEVSSFVPKTYDESCDIWSLGILASELCPHIEFSKISFNLLLPEEWFGSEAEDVRACKDLMDKFQSHLKPYAENRMQALTSIREELRPWVASCLR